MKKKLDLPHASRVLRRLQHESYTDLVPATMLRRAGGLVNYECKKTYQDVEKKKTNDARHISYGCAESEQFAIWHILYSIKSTK